MVSVYKERTERGRKVQVTRVFQERESRDDLGHFRKREVARSKTKHPSIALLGYLLAWPSCPKEQGPWNLCKDWFRSLLDTGEDAIIPNELLAMISVFVC